MENSTTDISRLCRACSNESQHMLSVFETMGNMDNRPRIDEMLMACTSIQIRFGDGLPTLICSSCADLLRASYLFKKKCEDTDSNFREYIKSSRNENKGVKQEMTQSGSADLTNNLLDKNSSVTISNVTDCVPPTDTKSDPDLHHNLPTSDDLKEQEPYHIEGFYKCKLCGKTYIRQIHLQRHEITHGRRKVHICKICNKSLTRLEHLKRHLVTHLKEKPFSCKTCNRAFNRAEQIRKHAVRCKGDRVHICNICNKMFNREDSLEVHKVVHKNNQPVLPTLENLDNIEEHYYVIDYVGNSKLSDKNDHDNKRDCFEPQIIITENSDQQVDLSPEEISDDENEPDGHVEQKEQINEVEQDCKGRTDQCQSQNEGKDQQDEEDESSQNNTKIDINTKHDSLKSEVDDTSDTKDLLIRVTEETCNAVIAQESDLYVAEDVDSVEDSDNAHSEYTSVKIAKSTKRKRGFPEATDCTALETHHTEEKTYTICGRGFGRKMNNQWERCQKRKYKKDSSTETSPKQSQVDVKQNENVKRHQQSFTFKEKMMILKRLDSEPMQSVLQEFNICDRTLRRWKQQKEDIEALSNEKNIAERKKNRLPQNQDLDDALYIWFLQARSSGIPISGAIIKKQAMKINQELNGDRLFRASDGWLGKWKNRKGIKSLKITEEKSSANFEAANDCPSSSKCCDSEKSYASSSS